MRGVWAKAESSDLTVTGNVPKPDRGSEAPPADVVCGPLEEADCPVSNDWDEV